MIGSRGYCIYQSQRLMCQGIHAYIIHIAINLSIRYTMIYMCDPMRRSELFLKVLIIWRPNQCLEKNAHLVFTISHSAASITFLTVLKWQNYDLNKMLNWVKYENNLQINSLNDFLTCENLNSLYFKFAVIWD